MTNFTVVAYRENYVDTCRGCVVGRTGSAMEISVLGSAEEAAAKIAQYSVMNDARSSEYADWETTLLVDGRRDDDVAWGDEDYDDQMAPFELVRSLADSSIAAERARLKREAEEKAERERADRERRQRDEIARKEREEKERLRELMEKYPDVVSEA